MATPRNSELIAEGPLLGVETPDQISRLRRAVIAAREEREAARRGEAQANKQWWTLAILAMVGWSAFALMLTLFIMQTKGVL